MWPPHLRQKLARDLLGSFKSSSFWPIPPPSNLSVSSTAHLGLSPLLMNLHVLLSRHSGFTSRREESSRACLESLGSTVNLNGGDSFDIYHCETQWQLEPIVIWHTRDVHVPKLMEGLDPSFLWCCVGPQISFLLLESLARYQPAVHCSYDGHGFLLTPPAIDSLSFQQTKKIPGLGSRILSTLSDARVTFASSHPTFVHSLLPFGWYSWGHKRGISDSSRHVHQG